MIYQAAGSGRNLVVRVHTLLCALPLTHVVETMRPLPLEPIAGMPSFVSGVSIIRGMPTPIVDLGVVLGALGGVAGRLVTLRLGNRQVALSVDAVVGIRDLDLSTTQELPPLLQGAPQDIIDAIGTLDDEMLMVLRAGWELPSEVWQTLIVQAPTVQEQAS